MSMKWVHENPPHWDEAKARIVAGAPEGIFDNLAFKSEDIIPGEWWHVEDDGEVLGYGWMDNSWGDAEILLCVDSTRQKSGVGSFIIEQLDREARTRGLNYLYNVVQQTHPDAAGLTAWLNKRGFEKSHDDNLLRRQVNRPK